MYCYIINFYFKKGNFFKKKKGKKKLLKNLVLYHESLYQNESKKM